MEAQGTVHEVRCCILILAELYAPAEDVAACCEPVQPDVRTVNDSRDETLVHRVVDLVPERRDQRVVDPTEHTANRNKAVLDVCVAGIAAHTIAPGVPAALIDCSDKKEV